MGLVDDFDDDASCSSFAVAMQSAGEYGSTPAAGFTDIMPTDTVSFSGYGRDDDEISVGSEMSIEGVEFGMPTLTSSGTMKPPKEKSSRTPKKKSASKQNPTILINEVEADKAKDESKNSSPCCSSRRLIHCTIIMIFVAACIAAPLIILDGKKSSSVTNDNASALAGDHHVPSNLSDNSDDTDNDSTDDGDEGGERSDVIHAAADDTSTDDINLDTMDTVGTTIIDDEDGINTPTIEGEVPQQMEPSNNSDNDIENIVNEVQNTKKPDVEGVVETPDKGSSVTQEKEVKSVLEALAEVSGDRIWVSGTPQKKAAAFIGSDDPRGPRDTDDPLFLQRYALATLYFSTNGDEWKPCGDDCELRGNPFLSEAHECTWLGIMCHPTGHVATIDIEGFGLKGEIPHEIVLLDSLLRLNVKDNQITAIPDSLARTKIVELELSNNKISSFPPSFYGKNTLEKISIDRNDFKGVPLPRFDTMPKLEHIQAQFNGFIGPIDPKLGNLKKLRNLDLSFNNLTGSLPPALGKLEKLVRLDLDANQLTGFLPSEIVSMPRLIVLSISSNMLLGQIPAEIGEMGSFWYETGLQRDKIIRINNNFLEGSLPQELGDIQGLTELALYGAGNMFEDGIPQALCDSTELQLLKTDCSTLDCSCTDACECLADDLDQFNQDENAIHDESINVAEEAPQIITPSYSEHETFFKARSSAVSENLEVFSMLRDFSGMSAAVPQSPAYDAITFTLLWDFSGVRDINDPRLLQRYAIAVLFYATGKGPHLNAVDECEWIGILCDEDGFVTDIQLAAQGLRGSIPVELGVISTLKTLDLSNNQIVGTIPESLEETNLESLLLSNNEIEGPFPDSLYNVKSIKEVAIDQNLFSGSLPDFASMPNLIHISAFDNNFVGPIEPRIGSLKSLKTLLLSSNQLEGSIPSKIGKLDALENLELHNNMLEGRIPEELLELPRLLSLSLANNLLTGEIDRSIKGLGSAWTKDGDDSKPKIIRLEQNQLSGTIPRSLMRVDNLYVLTLHSNNFSGELPEFLCDLEDLYRITSDCSKVDCSCTSACECIDGDDTDPSVWMDWDV